MEIVVISPADGKHHVGYWDEKASMFYSFASFEDKALAEALAYRQQRFNIDMNRSIGKV